MYVKPLSLASLASVRVAAPSVRFVQGFALASCWPLPQQLLPVSATGSGRRRCPSRGASGETGDFAVIHCGLLLFPSAVKCHLPAKGPTIRGAVTVGDWGVEPQAAAVAKPLSLASLARSPSREALGITVSLCA